MQTSVPLDVYISCRRKRRYELKKQARRALLRCWKRGRDERSLYPCEHCGGFHLTKKPPGEGDRET